ncbi:hypothetical protein SDC9_203096 [bioreactor metagenome]|uniref:Uncharacterized protein n=1 Tax=bioreactor metagenome TaxID=1076179 RepID=A0A645J4K2_9ZZZZ
MVELCTVENNLHFPIYSSPIAGNIVFPYLGFLLSGARPAGLSGKSAVYIDTHSVTTGEGKGQHIHIIVVGEPENKFLGQVIRPQFLISADAFGDSGIRIFRLQICIGVIIRAGCKKCNGSLQIPNASQVIDTLLLSNGDAI